MTALSIAGGIVLGAIGLILLAVFLVAAGISFLVIDKKLSDWKQK